MSLLDHRAPNPPRSGALDPRTIGLYLRHAAPYGGGVALLGLAALFRHSVRHDSAIIRGLRHLLSAQGLYADGVYGDAPGKAALHLAYMGDSIAEGLGAETPDQTPGVITAKKLAEALESPVRLTVLAESGTTSAALERQVTAALLLGVTDAVISTGVNNIRERQLRGAVPELERAVRRLTDANVNVVVLTCPDFSSAPALHFWWAPASRVLCRRFAQAQTKAVHRAGGISISMANLCQEFAADPDSLFSMVDRIHPSGAGYARGAQAVAGALLERRGFAVDETSIGTASAVEGAVRNSLTALRPASMPTKRQAPSSAHADTPAAQLAARTPAEPTPSESATAKAASTSADAKAKLKAAPVPPSWSGSGNPAADFLKRMQDMRRRDSRTSQPERRV